MQQSVLSRLQCNHCTVDSAHTSCYGTHVQSVWARLLGSIVTQCLPTVQLAPCNVVCLEMHYWPSTGVPGMLDHIPCGCAPAARDAHCIVICCGRTANPGNRAESGMQHTLHVLLVTLPLQQKH